MCDESAEDGATGSKHCRRGARGEGGGKGEPENGVVWRDGGLWSLLRGDSSCVIRVSVSNGARLSRFFQVSSFSSFLRFSFRFGCFVHPRSLLSADHPTCVRGVV